MAKQPRALSSIVPILLWLLTGPGALAQEADGAARETWHAETLTYSESGVRTAQFWSKGPKLRSETVVAGRRIVTIVSGRYYHSLDLSSGLGISIVRNRAAIAEDGKGLRPFATELRAIEEAGGERVGQKRVAGTLADVYRITDSRGRREVWVQSGGSRLPLRSEMFLRGKGSTIRTDYVQWLSGLTLPDSFFEPDPRIETTEYEYAAFLEGAATGDIVGVPVLFSHLLHGGASDPNAAPAP